jgi:hypothetical protein
MRNASTVWCDIYLRRSNGDFRFRICDYVLIMVSKWWSGKRLVFGFHLQFPGAEPPDSLQNR